MYDLKRVLLITCDELASNWKQALSNIDLFKHTELLKSVKNNLENYFTHIRFIVESEDSSLYSQQLYRGFMGMSLNEDEEEYDGD